MCGCLPVRWCWLLQSFFFLLPSSVKRKRQENKICDRMKVGRVHRTLLLLPLQLTAIFSSLSLSLLRVSSCTFLLSSVCLLVCLFLLVGDVKPPLSPSLPPSLSVCLDVFVSLFWDFHFSCFCFFALYCTVLFVVVVVVVHDPTTTIIIIRLVI